MKTIDFNITLRDKIERGTHKVVWKNGLPIRIICWDRKGIKNGAGEDCPIVALVQTTKDGEILMEATANGHVYTYDHGSHQGLFVTYQESRKYDFTQMKSFTLVLARNGDNQTWLPHFFGLYHPQNRGGEFYMINEQHILNSYSQCVPYEGNEHLMNTQDPIPEFYDIREQ
jgi:hypothetical protein